jgi:hypothetical protein
MNNGQTLMLLNTKTKASADWTVSCNNPVGYFNFNNSQGIYAQVFGDDPTDFPALNPDNSCNPYTPNRKYTDIQDAEIEFVLATKAPNGTCFKGITRTMSPLSYDGADGNAQVTAIRNGNDVFNGTWAGNKYMNVFICGEIGGAAGYTTNPASWSGTAMTNGIWILHNYVGSNGTGSVNGSRALTHEVGPIICSYNQWIHK